MNEDLRYKDVFVKPITDKVRGIKNNILLTCNPMGYNYFYQDFYQSVKNRQSR